MVINNNINNLLTITTIITSITMIITIIIIIITTTDWADQACRTDPVEHIDLCQKQISKRGPWDQNSCTPHSAAPRACPFNDYFCVYFCTSS